MSCSQKFKFPYLLKKKRNISAFIKHSHLKSPLCILDINREGEVSQIVYVPPSIYFMEC